MAIDPVQFRAVLGQYPTGVTVVAAATPSGPVGMVVGSFTSVSLDPPLVAFLPQRDSSTYGLLKDAKAICVSILSAEQESLCRRFSSRSVADKWSGVPWSAAPSGAPRLDEAVAWIDCVHERTVEAGDHDIVLARIQALAVTKPVLPLLFFQGGYGRFAPASLVVSPEADILFPIRLADLARPELERLALDVGVDCGLQSAVGGSLVFVASAAPGDGRTLLRVGRRVPHVPPVGALFVAWAGEEAFNRWTQRLPKPATDDLRQLLLAGLERVRRRGYSVALHSPDLDGKFHRVRAIGGRRTDMAGERELIGLLASLEGLYEPERLDMQGDQSVRLISAPVFGPGGDVQMVVQLWDLPPGLGAEEIERRAQRAMAAGRTIGALLSQAGVQEGVNSG